MAVAVGAGEKRGMSRSGAGVGVVVVAVGEVCAVVEEKTESAFAELVAVAFQIVAAKLVDDNYHDQFGMGVVSRGEARRDRTSNENGDEAQRKKPADSNGAGEESHREVSLHMRRAGRKRLDSTQHPGLCKIPPFQR